MGRPPHAFNFVLFSDKFMEVVQGVGKIVENMKIVYSNGHNYRIIFIMFDEEEWAGVSLFKTLNFEEHKWRSNVVMYG